MGVVPPEPGLQRVPGRTCRRHGALFVSDEVMTGFRASRAGQWGLDGAIEGWTPDLITFGKVMGGGFPAAAFGGRADVMAHLAPEGPVYQAGTLSGNPIATTAGLATLRLADEAVYDHLDRHRRRPQGGRRRGAVRRRCPARRAGDGHDVLRLLHRPAGARLRGRVRPGHRRLRRLLPRDARRRCVTCRPRRTRRGSSPQPTTNAPSRPSSTPFPAPPARPPQPRPPDQETDDRSDRSSTCSGTGRCTTPRESSTDAATDSTSPTSASGWPSGSPSPSATATSSTCGSRRWSAPRRRRARWPSAAAWRSSPTSG